MAGWVDFAGLEWREGRLDMTGDSRLEEKLDAFSVRAKRIAPACDNEEQTKVSLINPYLELLGYDVRDPMVCRLEFRADIGQGREKVDYAIMRDGRPSLLIEAKAATEDFSVAREAPSQLQRYFIAENVEFAALTNGVVWQWYRGSQEGKLRETPFLVHDVRSALVLAARIRRLRCIADVAVARQEPLQGARPGAGLRGQHPRRRGRRRQQYRLAVADQLQRLAQHRRLPRPGRALIGRTLQIGSTP